MSRVTDLIARVERTDPSLAAELSAAAERENLAEGEKIPP
jgi:hypothetical protein